MTLCGDGDESEWFLHRKISFFDNLLTLQFGPTAADHLKQSYPAQRIKMWAMLSEILVTWQKLCQQEQIFLVEALERLHVNQQLNVVSMNLLGDVLSKTNKELHSLHALLLVNNKLLGLYSNERTPELIVSDILMLTILVKNTFNYDESTVPLSICRTIAPFGDKDVRLKKDEQLFTKSRQSESSSAVPISNAKISDTESDISSSSKFDYHSATSTPQEEDIVLEEEMFYTPLVGDKILFSPTSPLKQNKCGDNDSVCQSPIFFI